MIHTLEANSLENIIQFIVEIDKLKAVTRKVKPLHCENRYENSAEHSWQLAVFVLSVEQYCPSNIDILRVVKMVLLHDIGEIDTGDTMFFVEGGWKERKEKELQAVNRIFGILPEPIRTNFIELWEEFEFGNTKESQLANALDRAMPVILNLENEGQSWKENNISYETVISKIEKPIKTGFPQLWDYLSNRIAIAKKRGYFKSNNQVVN
ncbi:HD domain-containing protein [Tenacibaculum sp. C7A-26P2]|uniref:HD domain-containing protein n=1 Tax=Tenacibaculum sp. C7A-26P2 TaxID=3447504 RepID=UPI003F82C66D